MIYTTNFVRILKTVMAIPTTVQHLPVKQLKTVEEVILDTLVELQADIFFVTNNTVILWWRFLNISFFITW
jgi:hypothetical protein